MSAGQAGRLSGPLGAGATVALVAPASPISPEALEEAVSRLEALGLRVRVSAHILARDGFLAGADRERLEDLAWAFTAPGIDAVWAARGGYGCGRIVDDLPWPEIERAPRPFVGLSDVTALHLALGRRGIPSFHGPMPAVREGWTDYAVASLRDVLFRSEVPYEVPPVPPGAFPDGEVPVRRTLRPGTAEGTLVGGNLTLIAAAEGTPTAVDTRDAILFLEDVGESPYRLDRYLGQLSRSGALSRAAGVALGTYVRCEAEEGPSALEVVRQWVEPLGVPAIEGLPLGHGPVTAAVPMGVRVRLDADAVCLTVLRSPFRGA